MILFLFIQFVFFVIAVAFKFDDITYIFPENPGIIAAFGHFNSDEYTDLFSLQKSGTQLQIFVFSKNEQQFQPHVHCTFESVITSVVPGDFNGDSRMDVLITLTTASDSTALDVRILWGNGDNLACNSQNLFTLANQPLIVDFNGDMIPDIIGEMMSGERNVWLSSRAKTFSNRTLANHQKFKNPHSSGLLDMNDDLVADILIMGEDYIEIGINYGDGFNFTKGNNIHYPEKISDRNRLQATFVDLNLDARLDLILPVCHDHTCEHSAIVILNKTTSKWELLLDEFHYSNATWGFKLAPTNPPLDMAALSVTLRSGDIDMDGYPDFLTILESKSSPSKSRPVLIKNSPCVNCSHCFLDRCLKVIWDIPGLQDIPNIEIAAFFDIFEDGVLDIIASSKTKSEWKIHALKNLENPDFCFMKVLVLSGLCNNCSSAQMHQSAYGVNQPGPIVLYNMTRQDGHPLFSSAVQISQTAYFPLHLPYSVFGLGQTPNFIDTLTISIPAKFNTSIHKREWTQIIPNSQIVVIPYPPNDERKWVKRLFVTPSHNVFLTCMALVGTCLFITVIVGILHWKERKEDKKEKMQDAYRFHFDAM